MNNSIENAMKKLDKAMGISVSLLEDMKREQEIKTIKDMNELCVSSLDPEFYEKWQEIIVILAKTRYLLVDVDFDFLEY